MAEERRKNLVGKARYAQGSEAAESIRKINRRNAQGGRPRRVVVTSALYSTYLFRDNQLDRRSQAGKDFEAHTAALAAHVGGNPSTVQQELITTAARLRIVSALAWTRALKDGVLTKDGDLVPAAHAFLQATRRHIDVLRLLGLRPTEKEVPSLAEYLKAREIAPEADDGNE